MTASALESLQLEEVLEHVNVPSYHIDAAGIVRWLNPAAERIVGDVRGRQFTSVVAPEDTRRAKELLARKIVGGVQVTDAGVVVLGADGSRVAVEVSSVPLRHGDHVVGVFGQVTDVIEEPHERPEINLTPRQAETSATAASTLRSRSTSSRPSSGGSPPGSSGRGSAHARGGRPGAPLDGRARLHRDRARLRDRRACSPGRSPTGPSCSCSRSRYRSSPASGSTPTPRTRARTRSRRTPACTG